MATTAGARSRVQMRVRNSSHPNMLRNSGAHLSSADGSTRRPQSMRRLILKQGYLKKLPNAAKLGAPLKKAVRRWFVFGVISGTNPYLEYYVDEDSVFTGHPINIIFLDTCHDVTQASRHSRQDCVFTVVLRDRNLRLVAQTRTVMLEWARILTEKLLQLDVLESNGPNDYVIPPMARPSRHSIHSGVSFPTQVHNRQRSHSASRLGGSYEETSQDPDLLHAQIERYLDCGGTFEADLFQPNGNTGAATNGQNTHMDSVAVARPTGGATAASYASSPPPEVNETDPFPAEAAQAEGATAATPGALTKMQEANNTDMVVGWNNPPEADERAPPPYMARGVLQRGAHVSLKHSQVSQLKGEMASESGVTLALSKLDCHQTLAFIDCFHAIWIAGWNQTARPHLFRSLHIGDQVISVNGQVVESAKMATKLIKSCTNMDSINIVIRRLPHAKVFGFRRTVEGESLGINRTNGTAEIVYVSPEGLAAQQGLSAKAQSLDKDNFCNWWITEVNHRPLNLYFRQDEIEHRLNAVGRDISLVVQPIEFINQLKHQLKKLKYYKDFMVQ